MMIKKVSLILLIMLLMLLSATSLNRQISSVSEDMFENLMNEPITIQIPKVILKKLTPDEILQSWSSKFSFQNRLGA